MGKLNTLTNDQLEALLEEHAESLLVGEDRTDVLVAQHGRTFPLLDGLLRLARRLYALLVPVEPSDEFVSALRVRLVEAHARQMKSADAWNSRRERVRKLSNTLGLAVSALALIAVAARVIGSIVMLVMVVVRGRRRRSPAAA